MTHEHYLLEALKLAEMRKGFCAPNPSVGAVLVKDNEIIGKGYHEACGLPHAEVEAIKNVKNPKDATLYVTLEPCCHFGRTPPCTELIIQSGIQAVYYGFSDPNPIVSNQGDKLLKEAGIDCKKLSIPEIESFYKSYAYWHRTKRPFVTAKIALSLDGKIAGANRKPITITGNSAKSFTHHHRLHSDAILTTADTINLDDPQLNVRLNQEILAKPIYIIDTNLKTLPTSQIFKTAGSVTIFHSNQLKTTTSLREDTRYLPIALNDGFLDLSSILDQIGQDDCHDLWVEAGGLLFKSLINAHFLQRAYVIIGPKFLGTEAYSSAFNKPFDLANDAKLLKWENLGDDGLMTIDYM
ncbi:MAG: bifunctional diaminohydroxyphosphoribosylaminopyrimidine deaminase/5-amino-6-(5-phosphoribosylamino)uracil reductase RibD [Gammaproteobacteria bacterium]